MNKHIGSTLDSFLDSQGMHTQDVELAARVRIAADNLQMAIEAALEAGLQVSHDVGTGRVRVARTVDL